MSERAKELLAEALTLSEGERRLIAEGLDAKLEDDACDDPEFIAEIVRRNDEAHANPERLIDGPTAVQTLRARLAGCRDEANP